MSYKVKRYLCALLVVVSLFVSQVACGGYRGEFGDGLGIADKVECPKGDCD